MSTLKIEFRKDFNPAQLNVNFLYGRNLKKIARIFSFESKTAEITFEGGNGYSNIKYLSVEKKEKMYNFASSKLLRNMNFTIDQGKYPKRAFLPVLMAFSGKGLSTEDIVKTLEKIGGKLTAHDPDPKYDSCPSHIVEFSIEALIKSYAKTKSTKAKEEPEAIDLSFIPGSANNLVGIIFCNGYKIKTENASSRFGKDHELVSGEVAKINNMDRQIFIKDGALFVPRPLSVSETKFNINNAERFKNILFVFSSGIKQNVIYNVFNSLKYNTEEAVEKLQLLGAKIYYSAIAAGAFAWENRITLNDFDDLKNRFEIEDAFQKKTNPEKAAIKGEVQKAPKEKTKKADKPKPGPVLINIDHEKYRYRENIDFKTLLFRAFALWRVSTRAYKELKSKGLNISFSAGAKSGGIDNLMLPIGSNYSLYDGLEFGFKQNEKLLFIRNILDSLTGTIERAQGRLSHSDVKFKIKDREINVSLFDKRTLDNFGIKAYSGPITGTKKGFMKSGKTLSAEERKTILGHKADAFRTLKDFLAKGCVLTIEDMKEFASSKNDDVRLRICNECGDNKEVLIILAKGRGKAAINAWNKLCMRPGGMTDEIFANFSEEICKNINVRNKVKFISWKHTFNKELLLIRN